MEMHTDVLLVAANVGSLFDNVSLLFLNPFSFSISNIRSVNESTQRIILAFIYFTTAFATERAGWR